MIVVFLSILFFIVILFFLLWFLAPSGWMTHVKTVLLGLLVGAPAIIDQLANDIRWQDILAPRQAAIVGGVLVLMGIFARLRSRIKH